MPKKAEVVVGEKKCTPRCHGLKMLVLGVLVLLNAKFAWLDWASFIGVLMVLVGVVKLLVPKCMCQK